MAFYLTVKTANYVPNSIGPPAGLLVEDLHIVPSVRDADTLRPEAKSANPICPIMPVKPMLLHHLLWF